MYMQEWYKCNTTQNSQMITDKQNDSSNVVSVRNQNNVSIEMICENEGNESNVKDIEKENDVIEIEEIDNDTDNEDNETLLLKREMVIILGISVSIDAFVVGFTGFNYISSALKMIGDCSIVGLITLILCSFTFYLCRYIRKIGFIAKYASFFGGVTLIIFAIKMIFF